MSIGDSAKSVLIRGALFWFVFSTMRAARRKEKWARQAGRDHGWTLDTFAPATGPSFSKAGFGFVGSLAVMIILMVALAGPSPVPAPKYQLADLRGTI